jgi:hypothetical protein
MALTRKNALFAGHDEGARNWGRIASLIETAKMNGVEPAAYLTATYEGQKSGRTSASKTGRPCETLGNAGFENCREADTNLRARGFAPRTSSVTVV